MIKFFDQIHENLLNVVFPAYCNGCSKLLLKNEKIICTLCIHNLPLTHHHLLKETEIHKVFYGLIPFEFGASLLYFRRKGIAQNLMHNLKYKNQQEIGTYLGDYFSKDLLDLTIFKDIDWIIPVPLHKKRFHERGYNQVTTFCESLEKNLSIPIINDVLVKSVHLKSQIQKSKATRLETIKNVFKIENAHKIEEKHILLVDDIFTTGATIETCAKEILKIKDTKISIITIAFTQS
jgi:ComF family protein